MVSGPTVMPEDPYKGQNITIKFTGTEDSTLQTSFVIDDTALTTQ
jgi:hypothetical protein